MNKHWNIKIIIHIYLLCNHFLISNNIYCRPKKKKKITIEIDMHQIYLFVCGHWDQHPIYCMCAQENSFVVCTKMGMLICDLLLCLPTTNLGVSKFNFPFGSFMSPPPTYFSIVPKGVFKKWNENETVPKSDGAYVYNN